MKRHHFFIFVLLWLGRPQAEPVFLPMPQVENTETVIGYKTRIIVEGEGEQKAKWDRWKNYYGSKVIRKFTKGEEEFLYASEEAILNDGSHIMAESTYRAAGSLIPLTYSRQLYGPSGQEILQESISLSDPATKLPPNTYGLPLSFALRGLAESPSEKREFYFYVGEGQASRMYVERAENETVTVPAGTFPCYRFKISVDLKSVMPMSGFVSMVASAFVQSLYFWFSQKPPHPFIKYQGSVGPPGSPSIVMEAVSIRAVPLNPDLHQ